MSTESTLSDPVWPQIPTRPEGSWSRYVFHCDCADWHYIEVVWDDEDEGFRWLTIEDAYAPRRLRDRVRAACRLLVGKTHYHSGIVLDDRNVRALQRVLGKHHPFVMSNGATQWILTGGSTSDA